MKIPSIKISRKFFPITAELLHADGRTDMKKLTVALSLSLFFFRKRLKGANEDS